MAMLRVDWYLAHRGNDTESLLSHQTVSIAGEELNEELRLRGKIAATFLERSHFSHV